MTTTAAYLGAFGRSMGVRRPLDALRSEARPEILHALRADGFNSYFEHESLSAMIREAVGDALARWGSTEDIGSVVISTESFWALDEPNHEKLHETVLWALRATGL